jgi:hypothetical protein
MLWANGQKISTRVFLSFGTFTSLVPYPNLLILLFLKRRFVDGAGESCNQLTARFELPFNIWCGTCGASLSPPWSWVSLILQAHIGAGVRYNAQKKKVGNYYSTPIFGFRCKCHLCSGWFELRTDPKVCLFSCVISSTECTDDRMRRMRCLKERKERMKTGIRKRMVVLPYMVCHTFSWRRNLS